MLLKLEETIRNAFLPFDWNPTNEQLLDIAEQLSSLPLQTDSHTIATIICEVCKVTSTPNLSAGLEGEDQTDLKTLLLLARNVVGK
ncbi:hypothetical protein J0A78_02630 [Providencia rettgeri]|uniref:hypothetical protein n=1 Tax=Providencia rettgeri TaxID=587 RepID=UPI0019D42E65|nr:hypothetical protein [Providencia rettgeri]MBN7842604.1 hypothetical protein [Providencia rettgeri]MBN7852832.1 hypothetical protein [Providencia rettgeri]MBN7864635.1 hypothetical protein [Providencia rettgeri]MBN7874700.1 hypothetical protein [Providencia rettgeri]MBN7895768.1 hypothetical protein [Providencia rettgeri]